MPQTREDLERQVQQLRDDYEGMVERWCAPQFRYLVWRSGKNPDAIDYDRISNSFYDGMDSDSAARVEIQAQERRERWARGEQADREEGDLIPAQPY